MDAKQNSILPETLQATFTGKEGEPIPLETAAAMTACFREQYKTGAQAHFFGRDILLAILNQKDCVGIRIYYGLNDKGGRELVLVGADCEQNDMENGIVADRSLICPNVCSKPNVLNGGECII